MACLLQRGQEGARRAEDTSGSRHAVPANAKNKTQYQTYSGILTRAAKWQLSGRHRAQNGAIQ